jgi:putative endonuclease
MKAGNIKKETEKQRIGRIGEDTACRFLVKRGFEIIEQNYRRKWGEIDVVARKGGLVHFVEVKTVTRNHLREVTRESGSDGYRPEENVHPWKLKRLHRAIQTYLADRNLEDADWQLDVVVVYLDLVHREAKVELIENVI